MGMGQDVTTSAKSSAPSPFALKQINMKDFLYYSVPCELWQNLLKEPRMVLDDILDYLFTKVVIDNMEEDDKSDEGFQDAIDTAVELLGITLGDVVKSLKRGGELLDVSHKSYCGVYFRISREQFFNLYDGDRTPTTEELLKVLAYMALKSISGKKKIARTNNNMFWARMACYPSVKQYEHNHGGLKKTNNKKDPTDIRTYFTRYYSEKLRRELKTDYHNFKCYSNHMKGFVFTFDESISLEDLIYYAKSETRNEKVENLRNEQEIAERRAMERLAAKKSKPSKSATSVDSSKENTTEHLYQELRELLLNNLEKSNQFIKFVTDEGHENATRDYLVKCLDSFHNEQLMVGAQYKTQQTFNTNFREWLREKVRYEKIQKGKNCDHIPITTKVQTTTQDELD